MVSLYFIPNLTTLYIFSKELLEDESEDNGREIEKTVKEFLSLNNPTQELMKVIINRIEVHQDKQIDIFLNFLKYHS